MSGMTNNHHLSYDITGKWPLPFTVCCDHF